jgi:DNA polymerase elongation subunit (family B)
MKIIRAFEYNSKLYCIYKKDSQIYHEEITDISFASLYRLDKSGSYRSLLDSSKRFKRVTYSTIKDFKKDFNSSYGNLDLYLQYIQSNFNNNKLVVNRAYISINRDNSGIISSIITIIDNKKTILKGNEYDILISLSKLLKENSIDIIVGYDYEYKCNEFLEDKLKEYNIIEFNKFRDNIPFSYNYYYIDALYLFKNIMKESQTSYQLKDLIEDKFLIDDCELLQELDSRYSLIDILLYLNQDIPVNIDQVLSAIVVWNSLLYREYCKHKLLFSFTNFKKKFTVRGAINEIVSGFYSSILGYDFKSMYANILITYNISPETLITKPNKRLIELAKKYTDKDSELAVLNWSDSDKKVISKVCRKENVIMSYSGDFYSKDKPSIVSNILKPLIADRYRVENNNSIIHNDKIALAKKTLIASCYGYFTSNYSQLSNIYLAQSITTTGRVLTQAVKKNVNSIFLKEYGYKPFIYSDTDSVDGNSILVIREGCIEYEITIEDLYSRFNYKNSNLEKSIINVRDSNLYTRSLNRRSELEYKKILYIMRHDTNKVLYEVSTNSNSVIITEDHSLIIERDNQLLDIKPDNIEESDNIFEIN